MRPVIAIGACAMSLALSACGGFDNTPLKQGTVRGRLLETDQTAVVAIFGSPQLAVAPAANGDFELKGILQGQVEVFAIASASRATRFKLQVEGGAISQAGTVQPKPAAWIELKLQSPSMQLLGRTKVHVNGTPLVGLDVDDDGDSHVGPLPAGCYEVAIDAPGLGNLTRLACVTEGVETHVEADLPDPDGTQGHEGCSVTGCAAGYSCAAGGECVP